MGEQQGASLLDAALRAFPLLRQVDPRGCLVGGAVRDLLLGRVPRDADVAIRGAADEAEQFAKRAGARMVRLGAEPFDVIRVVARGAVYDFAEIVGDTIEADLERRDFTIGAIALPLAPPHELVDPFAGRADLESSTLRMVRESNFSDDPLRVVRGLRLMAELSLTIDPATLDAMRRHSREVVGMAAERLGVEWLTLLSTRDERGLRAAIALVRGLGLDASLAGGTIDDTGAGVVAGVRDGDAVTRLAALALTGDEPELCAAALRMGLGASRVDSVRRAAWLTRAMIAAGEPAPIDPVALHDAGEDASRRAIVLLRAMGQTRIADAVESVIGMEGSEIFGARPLLDGNEIGAATGIAPGPRIGELRRALLVAQLRGDVRDREAAHELVRRLAREEGR